MPGKYASWGVAVSYRDELEISDFQPEFCKCKLGHGKSELQEVFDNHHAIAKRIANAMVDWFNDLLPGEWARLILGLNGEYWG